MWPWLPTLLVILVTALALSGASWPPASSAGRRVWIASLGTAGCLAIAATVWQGQHESDNPPVLSGTTAPANSPADLREQVKALEDRISELEAGRQMRTIAPDTAEKLAAYLRASGSRRVIVSAIPDDIEAYQYAYQLISLLKAANWDAQGPQLTKIFGDVRSPAINFYVNGEDRSDTAKLLSEAFTKFAIPYQTRVPPSQTIPGTDAVELFIGTMHSDSAKADADLGK
jgi:hypothetical protein